MPIINDLSNSTTTIRNIFDTLQLDSSLYTYVSTEQLTPSELDAINYTISVLFAPSASPQLPQESAVIAVRLKNPISNTLYLLLITPDGANTQVVNLYKRPVYNPPTIEPPPPLDVPVPTVTRPTQITRKYATSKHDLYSISGYKSSYPLLYTVGVENQIVPYTFSIRNRSLNANLRIDLDVPSYLVSPVGNTVVIPPLTTTQFQFVFNFEQIIFTNQDYNQIVNVKIHPVYNEPVEIE